MTDEDLDFRIARLELKPGDTLVLRLEKGVTPKQQELVDLCHRFERVVPGMKVMVLNHGAELSVLSKTNADSAKLRELLKRARTFVIYDVQMAADLTRHSPLDFKSQAVHDSTETESEKLLPEIDAALMETPNASALLWSNAWLPIETAPKNAAMLLRIVELPWPGYTDGDSAVWSRSHGRCNHGTGPKATHWMPMPEAPK